MSVLLIRPKAPDTSQSGLVSVQYPINIGYLSAYLKKHGIACAIKDFEVEDFSESVFLDYIEKMKPSVVGFSCMTPHINSGAYLASLIKSKYPCILTIVGGVHATALPERTLKEFLSFDLVIMGEGEKTLLELCRLRATASKIDLLPGIALRKDNTVRINKPRVFIEDLDEIPFPDRSAINMELYKRSHVTRGLSRKMYRIAEIMYSRGCPYECIFCASKVVHSQKVRYRSIGNIIMELDYLRRKHKINHFSFLDDTFTLRKDIMVAICDYIKSHKLTFDCLTRISEIDEENISLLVKSGCKKISFGIESGSPRILKLLKKGITVPQIEKGFFLARKVGLPLIETSFMIGSHPDETMDDIALTKKMIHKLKPDILALFATIPYPGTELYSLLKERNLLIAENWNEFKLFFGRPSWKLCNIPSDKLPDMLKEIIYSYYLSPVFILSLLRRIRNFSELKYWVAGGISLVKIRFRKRQ